MKKSSFYLILLMVLSTHFVTFAQERTSTISVELTESAVNRFLASRSYSSIDTVASGNRVRLSITTPQITLSNSTIGVSFTINANVGNQSFSFPVNPSIQIPNNAISVRDVSAFFQNFPSYINSNSSIPNWLKPVIITAYQNTELPLYPGRLIMAQNNLVPANMSLSISSIEVSGAVSNGKLRLNASVTARGIPPDIRFRFQGVTFQGGGEGIRYKFWSNVSTIVRHIKIYLIDGTLAAESEFPIMNIPIPKNGESSVNTAELPVSANRIYLASIEFESPFGHYFREYLMVVEGSQYRDAQVQGSY
jgi:hypothetical protein